MAMVSRAERMVAQNFDHPALGDPAARALHEHAFEFRLEGRQPREAAFDFGELRPGDGIGCGTGPVGLIRQAEQIADRFQCEAQVARMANEGQSFECLAAVSYSPTLGQFPG